VEYETEYGEPEEAAAPGAPAFAADTVALGPAPEAAGPAAAEPEAATEPAHNVTGPEADVTAPEVTSPTAEANELGIVDERTEPEADLVATAPHAMAGDVPTAADEAGSGVHPDAEG
jgi:hypothetical protein